MTKKDLILPLFEALGWDVINKHEDEVSAAVKSLTSILEPLMIVFVAVVVAVILVAMYLPMFSMMSTVG